MNLNNKIFIPVENKNGLSSSETIFHYFQNSNVISGQYKGGAIQQGFIVGKQVDDLTIELLFQCLTKDGELKVGESKGIVSQSKDGKYALKFDWKWLNGDLSGGKSEYIEIEQV